MDCFLGDIAILGYISCHPIGSRMDRTFERPKLGYVLKTVYYVALCDEITLISFLLTRIDSLELIFCSFVASNISRHCSFI